MFLISLMMWSCFVAASSVTLEIAPCSPLSCEHRLSGAVASHEHAVVVWRVLVEQARFDEMADNVRSDAPPQQIGVYTLVARVRWWKDEHRPLSLGRRPGSPYGQM